jgi:tRNA U34 5-carboxymethylaminomethyl modifying enzyme MnmG/GidA
MIHHIDGSSSIAAAGGARGGGDTSTSSHPLYQEHLPILRVLHHSYQHLLLQHHAKSSPIMGSRLDGFIGIYSPEERKLRIQRFLEKRKHRMWLKKVKYDVRKVILFLIIYYYYFILL